MRIPQPFSLVTLVLIACATQTYCQQFLAPEPSPGVIAGTVTTEDGEVIPGATITLSGGAMTGLHAVSSDNGQFQIRGVPAGKPFSLSVRAEGFAEWKSPANIVLSPGQFDFLTNIQLLFEGGAESVTVSASPTELAVEQVKLEEQQRVFGFLPNYYVVYTSNPAPLSSRLKFRLAYKVSIDPITFAGTAFLAGLDQAAHYPNYPEGAKGFGQRFGSIYASDFTDIMIGGAILPSLLHQDPRYFYQGTGSKRSRLFHALSTPIICRGDNGRAQPNISSLGGYLASGAIANTYYPQSNRGAGLVAHTFAVNVAADMANGVLQEFVLRRFTPSAKPH